MFFTNQYNSDGFGNIPVVVLAVLHIIEDWIIDLGGGMHSLFDTVQYNKHATNTA